MTSQVKVPIGGVNKVANDSFSTFLFRRSIDRSGEVKRYGGDYSKANGFLVRRAETASRLHKSAPQIFAATRISVPSISLRPFNGSETRHKADPKLVYLLFGKKNPPALSRNRDYRKASGMTNVEFEFDRRGRDTEGAPRTFSGEISNKLGRTIYRDRFSTHRNDHRGRGHDDRCEECKESWYIQFNIIERAPSVFENPVEVGFPTFKIHCPHMPKDSRKRVDL